MNSIIFQLNSLKTHYEQSQRVLRSLDRLLEAHKQLTLVSTEQFAPEKSVDCLNLNDEISSSTQSRSQDECEIQLKQVQERIKEIETYNHSLKYLQNCSIPSVSASPAFYAALKIILESSEPVPLNIIERSCKLMEKCWDNGLLAIERVLERDLVSLEAYLDDRVYREIRDQVLIPLISLTKLKSFSDKNLNHFYELVVHFLASYTQLRQNFVTFILDQRLNSQFCDSSSKDQVLHLIERTRLLMVVETKEFDFIFFDYDPTSVDKNPLLSSHLNKILETVGNLLFARIEIPCRDLDFKEAQEISLFIYNLMQSIFAKEQNSKDPFGLFLQLLAQKFFSNPSQEINKQQSIDQIFNV